VTVIKPGQGQAITVGFVSDVVAEYTRLDDVWQTAFLSGVVFLVTQDAHLELDAAVQDYLKQLGNLWIDTLAITDALDDVQAGPYIILGGRLHDTYKLVDDSHGTFMTAVRPSTKYVPQCASCNEPHGQANEHK
jgi:hypothetical protein